MEVGRFHGHLLADSVRWRTLTLMKSDRPPLTPRSRLPNGTNRDDDAINRNVDFILKSFNDGKDVEHWHFPRLQELDIQDRDVQTALNWSSPSLCSLRCTRYLPIPSTTFSSVTSFHSFTLPVLRVGHGTARALGFDAQHLSLGIGVEIFETDAGNLYTVAASTIGMPLRYVILSSSSWICATW